MASKSLAQQQFQSLAQYILSVDHISKIHVMIQYDYEKCSSIISSCFDLFGNETFDIDDKETTLDKLPPNGKTLEFVFFDLDSKGIKAFNKLKDLCAEFCVAARNGNAGLNEEFLYLIGNQCYEPFELKKDPIVKNTLDCCFAYRRLAELADYSNADSFVLISDILIQYDKGIVCEDVCELKLMDHFSAAFDSVIDDKQIGLALLKSEINNALKDVKKEQRVHAFFERFDLIMQSYSISRGNYLKRYGIDNLKRELESSWISLNEKIRSTLQNLKAELLVFLTMFLTLSEYSKSWAGGNMAKNAFLLSGIVITIVIYILLIQQDKNALKKMKEDVEKEKFRIEQLPCFKMADSNDPNDKIQEMTKTFGSLKNSIKCNIALLWGGQIALFIPLALFLIMMSLEPAG